MVGAVITSAHIPHRILVVDDDHELRELMSSGLASRGDEVAAAANGEQALSRMRDFVPDLVVFDLMMPGMDGWQFRVAQKRDPLLARTPVVAISGSDSAAAAAIDADAYLRKPFDMATLQRAVDQVFLTRARLSDPARTAQDERMASLRTLAAGLAHEINNPLTYVVLHLTQARLLAADGACGSSSGRDIGEILDCALEGANRIRHITASVQSFSRIDPRDPARPLDVRPVLDGAAALVGHQIRPRAQLGVEHGPVPMVMATPARLGQVFLNLLINAAQAIPSGTDGVEHTIRTTTATDDAGWASIEIADTGCGIPEHCAGRILEPFFSTRPVGEGAGLGLFISHGIVTAFGGELTVTSEVGRGTTVRVRLPPAEP